MKLYELLEQTKVLVQVNKESLKGKIIKIDNKAKKIIINIDNKNLDKYECTISMSEKGIIYSWKVVLNDYVRKSGLYIINADVNSVYYNRRESFRVDIYKPAKIILRANGEDEITLTGTLKDLSAIGFGIILEKPIEEKLFNGKLFEFEFSDEDFSFSSKFQFKRIFEGKNYFFYGAKFINLRTSYKLDKYLSEQQRKMLKNMKHKK